VYSVPKGVTQGATKTLDTRGTQGAWGAGAGPSDLAPAPRSPIRPDHLMWWTSALREAKTVRPYNS
jgi:hypothetical protein